jgi:hypothetical protein
VTGHEDQCWLEKGRRAISGPLTPVMSGLSRSLADTPPRRSGHVTGPDGTDSQADSADSIPVTRSKVKSQFGDHFPNTGPPFLLRVKSYRGH